MGQLCEPASDEHGLNVDVKDLEKCLEKNRREFCRRVFGCENAFIFIFGTTANLELARHAQLERSEYMGGTPLRTSCLSSSVTSCPSPRLFCISRAHAAMRWPFGTLRCLLVRSGCDARENFRSGFLPRSVPHTVIMLALRVHIVGTAIYQAGSRLTKRSGVRTYVLIMRDICVCGLLHGLVCHLARGRRTGGHRK